jgi:hypothetical protein
MKISTCELKGRALDWVVATIEGYGNLQKNVYHATQPLTMHRKDGQCVLFDTLKYSADWALVGPILDRALIGVYPVDSNTFAAFKYQPAGSLATMAGHQLSAFKQKGPTAPLAAMRCYVESMLGSEVEVPDLLVP